MGTYLSTYVGVYIAATHYKEERKTKVYKTLQDKITKNRFNPQTGEENRIEEVVETEIVQPYCWINDREDLSEDEFFEPSFTQDTQESIFLVNSASKFGLHYSDIVNIDLSNVDIEQKMLEFNREYSEYLAYFREKFEKSNIEVKFGVVIYAH